MRFLAGGCHQAGPSGVKPLHRSTFMPGSARRDAHSDEINAQISPIHPVTLGEWRPSSAEVTVHQQQAVTRWSCSPSRLRMVGLAAKQVTLACSGHTALAAGVCSQGLSLKSPVSRHKRRS